MFIYLHRIIFIKWNKTIRKYHSKAMSYELLLLKLNIEFIANMLIRLYLVFRKINKIYEIVKNNDRR